MGMVKCGECGAQVSDKAKACPQCGAPKPKTSWAKKVGAVVLGFIALSAVMQAINGGADALPEKPAKTAEESARETAALNRALRAARAIRATMNDPKSFELVEAMQHSDGAVCMTYRGKNGFNATITKTAVVTAAAEPQLLLEGAKDERRFVKEWNALCTRAGAENVARMVNHFMD